MVLMLMLAASGTAGVYHRPRARQTAAGGPVAPTCSGFSAGASPGPRITPCGAGAPRPLSPRRLPRQQRPRPGPTCV